MMGVFVFLLLSIYPCTFLILSIYLFAYQSIYLPFFHLTDISNESFVKAYVNYVSNLSQFSLI